MKKLILSMYFSIAVICSLFYWKWGEYSYMNYGYNLGVAAVWPVSLFRSYPEIDGDSAKSFAVTLPKVSASGKIQGHVYFYNSIGYLALYEFAKQDESIDKKEIDRLLSSGEGMNRLFYALIENPEIIEAVREELHGKTFGEIVREEAERKDELNELVINRTPSDIISNWRKATSDVRDKVKPEKDQGDAQGLFVDTSSDIAVISSLKKMMDGEEGLALGDALVSLLCLGSMEREKRYGEFDATSAEVILGGCDYAREEVAYYGADALFNDVQQDDIALFRQRLEGMSATQIISLKNDFDEEITSLLGIEYQ